MGTVRLLIIVMVVLMDNDFNSELIKFSMPAINIVLIYHQ